MPVHALEIFIENATKMRQHYKLATPLLRIWSKITNFQHQYLRYLPTTCLPGCLRSGLLTNVITDWPHLNYVGCQTDRQTDISMIC